MGKEGDELLEAFLRPVRELSEIVKWYHTDEGINFMMQRWRDPEVAFFQNMMAECMLKVISRLEGKPNGDPRLVAYLSLLKCWAKMPHGEARDKLWESVQALCQVCETYELLSKPR
jgi:hypothetical protein